MKRKQTLVLLSVFLVFLFLYVKLERFQKVRQDIKEIKKSSLAKYLRVYDLTENRPLANIEEFKDYIRKKDVSLYETIEDIDLKYVRFPKDNYGQLYLKGFDNEDDSLRVVLELYNINFFNSLFLKGDILLEFEYKFKRNYNTLYEVKEDSVFEVEKVDIVNVYKKYLKCKEIKLKDSVPYGNQYKSTKRKVMIKKGEIIYDRSFEFSLSKKTMAIIETELKRKELDEDRFYVIDFISYNIEELDCY